MTIDTNDTTAAAAPDAAKPASQPRKGRQERGSKANEAQLKPATNETRGPSKIAAVIVLLERKQGATLAEMVEATGWLPHTTRAALTGLKKKGHVITKGKRDDVTCYHIAKAAQ